jgi:hypothetical protein
MLSIHDNNVYAYFVDCSNRCVVLHTSYLGRDPHEFTDVIFSGVVAHFFEHVLPGNILLGIEEGNPKSLIEQFAGLFQKSWRYGWPIANLDYQGDLGVLDKWLRDHSIRAFKIASAYGMSGWVLAENHELVSRTAPFRAV